MANRSYLYASDAIPDGTAKLAPRGLSECNYDIPLVHKLMVANAPRRVRSAIWNEHDIGIIANREGAAERATAFIAKLLEGEIADRDQLTGDLADMQQRLASTAATPYVLLEVGEILDMQGGDLAEGAQAVVDEIPALVARVDRAIAGNEEPWLAQLRTLSLEELNLGAWSEVLYFSFENTDATPTDDDDDDDDGDEEVAPAPKPAKPKATPTKMKARAKAAPSKSKKPMKAAPKAKATMKAKAKAKAKPKAAIAKAKAKAKSTPKPKRAAAKTTPKARRTAIAR
ncbi:MAG: hypothetical protein H0T79_13240 [Deltaproteobacteria bacterium]|nr:hypothetical protein [Deltaproteobacteria bacterium]